jgi:hypothetical protein
MRAKMLEDGEFRLHGETVLRGRTAYLMEADYYRSARAADRPSCTPNQPTQSRVHGSVVRKMLRDVGRKKDEVGSCRVARRIFSSNSALQF